MSKWTLYSPRTILGDPVIYESRDEWLKGRSARIGGSDAAAILGKNPWMTNEELWEIKTGRREQPDISNHLPVVYGNAAEAPLRELFKVDFPEYYVGYQPFNLFLNPDMPWAHASLDGWLSDFTSNKMGILEIKTTWINSSLQKNEWDGRIPDHYYCQILHYLMVTGWSFAILKAQLRYGRGEEMPFLQTKHFRIDRADVETDIAYLAKKEQEFWQYVVEDKRPPRILPGI